MTCTVGRLDGPGSKGALVQLTIHLGVGFGCGGVHLRVSLPPWPPVCQL